ncbi:hypothetical protein C4J81_13570 [Deltaproteobacteria bacterium Smac51]|nr:hypothetical protein C4J81_13570 [Deltaproteobacteria bacterium Smac51]
MLYTDHVLGRALAALKKYPRFETGLMYVSDHGESLGENNIYWHGLPYSIAPPDQKQVPMVLWMSEVMKRNSRVDYNCLKQAGDRPQSHDNLFHSLAGLLKIETRAYQPELDLFSPCRLAPLPPMVMEARHSNAE